MTEDLAFIVFIVPAILAYGLLWGLYLLLKGNHARHRTK